MSKLRQILKRTWFAIRGKDPKPVIVCALSGAPERAHQMGALLRKLVPDLEIVCIEARPDLSAGEQWLGLTRLLRGRRVALAATLFDGDPRGSGLRQAMLAFAPRRILAFNADLERHHLRIGQPVASILFLRGVPLDRIFLRPRWLWPFTRERSVRPHEWREAAVSPFRKGYPRVAIVSPYLPWPLSHGGAVRIWNLLSECAKRYDILYFGFEDGQSEDDLRRVGEICRRVYVADKPRYREPRWSTIRPPEVCEFFSPPLLTQLRRILRDHDAKLLQSEYTQMAAYGGDVLVEHDVTWDLFEQVHLRRNTLSSWWDLFRWRRFEGRAVRRHRRVITMSDKDAGLLGVRHATAVPNGVDLERFHPVAEPPTVSAAGILFVGSFRHFPNRQAWEFFLEEVWPRLQDLHASLRVVVVAGPDPHLYWRETTLHPNIELRGFTADVKPLYDAANVVIVPTLVSAGTNLKALEAMATRRAMVSTPSGVAGLGLVHGESAWIAESADGFAAGIRALLEDKELRVRIAEAAHCVAVQRFGWPALARLQLEVWDSLHPDAPRLRSMEERDIEAVAAIQKANPQASQWDPRDYLSYRTTVATVAGTVAAFLVERETAPGEVEILNLAVAPDWKRHGLASRLVERLPRAAMWLEVRESNQQARAFYESQGFRVAGRRDGYYSNPTEAALVLSRQVS